MDVVIEAPEARFLIPADEPPSKVDAGDMALTLGGIAKLWTTTGKARGDRRDSTRIELY